MINQFEVYLRGELGKLRYHGDAADFIDAAGAELLTEIGLPRDPAALARKLRSQDAVDAFVSDLSASMPQRLAKCCSVWRNNPDLYERLVNSDYWLKDEVQVEAIRVMQAEPSLGDVFRELDGSLPRIAVDPRVLSRPAYRSRSTGERVDYPVCLATRQGDIYVLFDGIHRAIQLVRNGKRQITVCFSIAREA